FADVLPGLLNNQAEDLEFGAPVTWKLHREWGDPANRANLPECLTIIGTNDLASGAYNQSDGVVPCNSASLENLGFPTYYVPLGHSPSFAPPGSGAIAFLGDGEEEGIEGIKDETHPSWPAIEGFLNTELGLVPANAPGHLGGSDDVGDKDHPEALPNGALYIVKVGADGEPETVSSVDLGHTTSNLPIETNGIHHLSGIFYANLVGANASSLGSRAYTTALSDVGAGGAEFPDQRIRVYAGETRVWTIGGENPEYTQGDFDGDGLPDSIEELIAAADPDDEITTIANIGPDNDFDGDLIPELLELALGTDPTKPEYGLPSFEIVGGEVIVRHPEVASLFGLRIACEAADSPGAAAAWSAAEVSSRLLPGNIREWRTPVGPGARFFRLRVLKVDE
ncbi:MAG: hypothetical protein ACR2RV_16770, partial [Verrucomicrobiales bacterium]